MTERIAQIVLAVVALLSARGRPHGPPRLARVELCRRYLAWVQRMAAMLALDKASHSQSLNRPTAKVHVNPQAVLCRLSGLRRVASGQDFRRGLHVEPDATIRSADNEQTTIGHERRRVPKAGNYQ